MRSQQHNMQVEFGQEDPAFRNNVAYLLIWKSMLRLPGFVAPIRVATVYLALAVFWLQVERGSFSTVSGLLLYDTVLLCYAGLVLPSGYLMLIVCYYTYVVLSYFRLCHAMLCNADHMLCQKYAMVCGAISARLCFALLCHALLNCAMLCCPLLCSSMLCYGVLCYMMSTC